MLRAGVCAFIPENVVHAIHNVSSKPMTFLAILSPAEAPGPFLIDCYDDEPWRSLRNPEARRTARKRPR
jgi:oxalate decarboxylase/phosphoglucose isomerase-like protein (cupin superfamily)